MYEEPRISDRLRVDTRSADGQYFDLKKDSRFRVREESKGSDASPLIVDLLSRSSQDENGDRFSISSSENYVLSRRSLRREEPSGKTALTRDIFEYKMISDLNRKYEAEGGSAARLKNLDVPINFNTGFDGIHSTQ